MFMSKLTMHKVDDTLLHELASASLRYRIIEKNGSSLLGSGTYGTVYRGVDTRTGKIVAMKKLKACSDEEGIPNRALREIAILKQMDHPNVIRLLDVLQACNSRLFLIFEHVETDLASILFVEKTKLTQATVQWITLQLFTGIDYFHRRGVIHRDLKPHNILVTPQYHVYIADFGIARTFVPPIRSMSPEIITCVYRPPELLLGAVRYTTAVDMWSAGVVMMEMLLNEHMFIGKSDLEVMMNIFRERGFPTEQTWPGVSYLPNYNEAFPQFPTLNLGRKIRDCEVPFVELLEGLLCLDPRNRFTAREALSPEFYDSSVFEMQNILAAKERGGAIGTPTAQGIATGAKCPGVSVDRDGRIGFGLEDSVVIAGGDGSKREQGEPKPIDVSSKGPPIKLLTGNGLRQRIDEYFPVSKSATKALPSIGEKVIQPNGIEPAIPNSQSLPENCLVDSKLDASSLRRSARHSKSSEVVIPTATNKVRKVLSNADSGISDKKLQAETGIAIIEMAVNARKRQRC